MMQIGQEVYTIEKPYLKEYAVVTKMLTGIVGTHSGETVYHLDHERTGLSIEKITCTEWTYEYRLFTSKKKAENVARSLNEQREAYKKKLQRERTLEKEIIEENKRWIDSIRQHIENKDVMVKVGWQHQKWAKAKIGEMKPWPYEKHVFMFNAHGNKYISSREGKNWYFDIEYV